MRSLLSKFAKLRADENGSVAIVMAFLFPVILLMGALAIAGTNYQSLASEVKAAAQSAATVGGVTGTTQSNMSAFCSALVAKSNGKIFSCTPSSGSLMADNTFCDSSSSCTNAVSSAVQVKVCGALANIAGKSLGNVCSTAVVAGNKISAVTTGVTGEGGLVPIAINGCMFNNGGTQNSGKGHTFWDDDNHKPFSSYSSKRIYLGWGNGDGDGVSGNYSSQGTGGSYTSGTDKQGNSYHFCSNTGNFLDFTGASSAGSASTLFNTVINSSSSTSTTFNDTKQTVLRSVDLTASTSTTGPTWLGSGKTLNIGDKVPALGGMADNASWYTSLNLTPGGTFLFPVVTSYPNSSVLAWGSQSLLTVAAFAPLTVNKVCLGSLGSGYITPDGKEYSKSNFSGTQTGCDYGSQPYTIPNNNSGNLKDRKVWLPYIDVSFKTGYKARNTLNKKNGNGDEGRDYGGGGSIKRYRNDEGKE